MLPLLRTIRSVTLLTIASTLLVGNAGCLFGGRSKVTREGNYVAASTIGQIKPGETTSTWVRAVIGEPTERIQTDPGREIWKYTYTETKDSNGYVFLIFSGGDSKVTTGTVFVEFDKGVVTRTWRG